MQSWEITNALLLVVSKVNKIDKSCISPDINFFQVTELKHSVKNQF